MKLVKEYIVAQDKDGQIGWEWICPSKEDAIETILEEYLEGRQGYFIIEVTRPDEEELIKYKKKFGYTGKGRS
jgi:hypothetical protein